MHLIALILFVIILIQITRKAGISAAVLFLILTAWLIYGTTGVI